MSRYETTEVRADELRVGDLVHLDEIETVMRLTPQNGLVFATCLRPVNERLEPDELVSVKVPRPEPGRLPGDLYPGTTTVQIRADEVQVGDRVERTVGRVAKWGRTSACLVDTAGSYWVIPADELVTVHRDVKPAEPAPTVDTTGWRKAERCVMPPSHAGKCGGPRTGFGYEPCGKPVSAGGFVPGGTYTDPDRTHATRIAELTAERNALRSLLAEFVDPDPCRYDHDDDCQGHSLHSRPCPHERAKLLLGNGEEA
jgi:hypothetical protein